MMLNLNNLVFTVALHGDGEWCVSIWRIINGEQKMVKDISCCSLSCVGDLFVSIDKVLNLFNFDESEVLSDES